MASQSTTQSAPSRNDDRLVHLHNLHARMYIRGWFLRYPIRDWSL
jgi:hypothetical protein